MSRVTMLLLGGVLLMCPGCGPSGEIIEQANEEQALTFDMLQAMEANVDVDDQGNIIGVDFESEDLGDDAVAMLKDVPTIERVGLAGSGVTDAGLEHLKELPALKNVDLEDTKVSRKAIRALQEALPDCRISYGGADE